MPQPIFELQPYNPDLRSARAVEIMRVGKWNDIEFELKDLDAMVEAFAARPLSVPLKIGLGEVSGLPAFGWVERNYRQGDTLLADFRVVPAWVFESVFVRHEYDHVSVEVFFNLKVDGKTYSRVLKAVALLGAETPAVNGLAPLRDAIFAPDANQYEKQVAFTLKVADPMPNPTPTQQPTPAPTIDAAAFTQLQATAQEQAAQIAALTKSIKEADEARNALLATVATLSKQNSDSAVAAKIASVKVPAVAEHFRHLYAHAMGANGQPKVVKFKAADGKEADRDLTAVIDELVAQVNKFAETLTKPALPRGGAQSNTNTLATFASASDELAQKVTAHMSEKGLKNTPENYTLATRQVLNADADLANRYQREYATAGAPN